MDQSLKIAVAEDEPDLLEYFQTILPRMGHEVVLAARSGNDLIEGCRAVKPDLIITDIKMPGLDGLQAATKIFRERPTPIIIVSAHHSPELLGSATETGVFAYLLKPIRQNALEAAITIVMRRFQEYVELRSEAGNLKQYIEDRKMIERAKGRLMTLLDIDEEEAYKRLQRSATDGRCKLVDAAKLILAVSGKK